MFSGRQGSRLFYIRAPECECPIEVLPLFSIPTQPIIGAATGGDESISVAFFWKTSTDMALRRQPSYLLQSLL